MRTFVDPNRYFVILYIRFNIGHVFRIGGRASINVEVINCRHGISWIISHRFLISRRCFNRICIINSFTIILSWWNVKRMAYCFFISWRIVMISMGGQVVELNGILSNSYNILTILRRMIFLKFGIITTKNYLQTEQKFYLKK